MENEGRVLLVAAHPDDEVIGAGIRMSRWNARGLTILHITNGSPRSVPDGLEYYATRRQELQEALAVGGLAGVTCREAGFIDQEAYLHLIELTAAVTALCDDLKPDVVYTHPYEGGHPDHDAAAFAVAYGVRCPVREFTSYHSGASGFTTGEFLGGGNIKTYTLSEAERDLKRRMFECYRSQQHVLQNFEIARERFRDAPKYNFTQAPHAGPLHYETLGWNMTGQEWRVRAAAALNLLSSRDVKCQRS